MVLLVLGKYWEWVILEDLEKTNQSLMSNYFKKTFKT